jgi:hypothetical protein
MERKNESGSKCQGGISGEKQTGEQIQNPPKNAHHGNQERSGRAKRTNKAPPQLGNILNFSQSLSLSSKQGQFGLRDENQVINSLSRQTGDVDRSRLQASQTRQLCLRLAFDARGWTKAQWASASPKDMHGL